jgi:prepilin-type N-terminal cleavage/methylation domain-containing protein
MDKKSRAFTLIETIMAIVLLGIIAVTIGVFITQQMQAVVWSKQYATALNLARLEMERVYNIPVYNNITSLTTNNYDLYGFDLVRTVSYIFGTDLTAQGLKQVIVEVRLSGSATSLVTIKTYIARGMSIGL